MGFKKWSRCDSNKNAGEKGMNQKRLANWLKVMILGVAICGILVYGMVILPLGIGMMLATGLTLVPCYIALIYSWKVMGNIANDHSFTVENARLLGKISSLSRIDSMFLFTWSILFFTTKITTLQILVISLFIVFMGVVVAAIFAALSHLVLRAADLQDQYDLTI